MQLAHVRKPICILDNHLVQDHPAPSCNLLGVEPAVLGDILNIAIKQDLTS